MDYSSRIKKRLLTNAIKLCEKGLCTGVERESAFLFDEISMNFHPETFAQILKVVGYKKRLEKQHSNVSDYKEMQSSNSSDALLMNLFAHPKIKEWKSLRDLIGINETDEIEFGWNPLFENEKSRKTEIDMKIGKSIFEAKLTETDFTQKQIEVVLTYQNVEDIIDISALTKDGIVSNYQLIRNLLAAYKYQFSLYILLDESRTDFIREFINVKNAIKDSTLSNSFHFITWQEVSNSVGQELRSYITEKYF